MAGASSVRGAGLLAVAAVAASSATHPLEPQCPDTKRVLAGLSPEAPVVGSLSTLPKRLPSAAFRELVDGLLRLGLLDRLYINYPLRFNRHKGDLRDELESEPVPEWLREMAGNHPRVCLLRCTDFGPATKLLPVLLQHDLGEETMIFTFDDDRVYHRGAVVKMMHTALDNPDRAVAVHPVSIKEVLLDGESLFAGAQEAFIDIISGTYGAVYRKGFFRDGLVFDYAGPPEFQEDCYFVDDTWLSGHLERAGVARMLIPGFRAKGSPTKIQLYDGLFGWRADKDCRCACAMRAQFGIWTSPSAAGSPPGGCSSYCQGSLGALKARMKQSRRGGVDFQEALLIVVAVASLLPMPFCGAFCLWFVQAPGDNWRSVRLICSVLLRTWRRRLAWGLLATALMALWVLFARKTELVARLEMLQEMAAGVSV